LLWLWEVAIEPPLGTVPRHKKESALVPSGAPARATERVRSQAEPDPVRPRVVDPIVPLAIERRLGKLLARHAVRGRLAREDAAAVGDQTELPARPFLSAARWLSA
jgi:hypothetical protein